MLPVIRPKARIRVERGCFAVGAGVVPQDAGLAQHLVGGVDERRPVHLPGQADAAHRAEPRLTVSPAGEPVHHRLGGGEPVRRALLRPALVRTRDGERRRRLGEDRLRVVDEHALQAGCAEIEADIGHDAPPSGFLTRRGARAACPG